MKHLLYLALISALLSGCADTPLKQAEIEDRAVVTTPFKTELASPSETFDRADKQLTDTAAKSPADSASVSTAGVSDANIAGKTLASAKTPKETAVKTQGIATQELEAKSLGSTPQDAAVADTTAAGNNKDSADALKYEAQPILDPSNPQSPLAQRRLQFDYDSSAIRDEYRTLLEMHAKYLKGETAAKLIVQGHADERGSREYNLALGQRRAESVYRALNLLGVADAQMEAVSLGEEKPISEGHDESAWEQNRRTELLYQGE
jgi:peptidoglycan-associated lipoprotein